MAEIRADQPLVPSVLDRLLDYEPDVKREPPKSRHQVLRELKQSVRRDLEALMARLGIAVSLPRADARGSSPLSFRLYLPKEWTDDPARCRAAGVPEGIAFQPNWRLALALFDEALAFVGADHGQRRLQRFVAQPHRLGQFCELGRDQGSQPIQPGALVGQRRAAFQRVACFRPIARLISAP